MAVARVFSLAVAGTVGAALASMWFLSDRLSEPVVHETLPQRGGVTLEVRMRVWRGTKDFALFLGPDSQSPVVPWGEFLFGGVNRVSDSEFIVGVSRVYPGSMALPSRIQHQGLVFILIDDAADAPEGR